ncbi:MAG: MFS transporter [Promethearchaeota archaeon]
MLFWNSVGFFFFFFILAYATAALMDASGTEMGLIFSSMVFGALVSTPLSGYLTDKSSKKRLILIGSFGRGVSYIILYFAIIISSLVLFGIGNFVLGFFVNLFWPPFRALVSEKSHKTKRSYAFGKMNGKMGLGNLFGSIISFTIFATTNYFMEETTPLKMVLQYFPLLLFAASNFYAGIKFQHNVDEHITIHSLLQDKGQNNKSVSPPVNEQNDHNAQNVQNSQNDPHTKTKKGLLTGLLFLAAASFLSAINITIADPFLQRYLIEFIEPNPTLVMLILFPSGVLSMLLSPQLGKLCDRINPSSGTAVVAIMGALFTWLLINSIGGWMFAGLLILDAGFAQAGGLISANITSRISKSYRGRVFGSIEWISRVGAIFGPILGGYFWDNHGPKYPFIISIFVEILLIIPFLIAIKYLLLHMEERIVPEPKLKKIQ